MSLILLILPLITALILWFSPINEKHSLLKKALTATL